MLNICLIRYKCHGYGTVSIVIKIVRLMPIQMHEISHPEESKTLYVHLFKSYLFVYFLYVERIVLQYVARHTAMTIKTKNNVSSNMMFMLFLHLWRADTILKAGRFTQEPRMLETLRQDCHSEKSSPEPLKLQK